VAYFLVIKRMQCATSKHPMRHLWSISHRLAILALDKRLGQHFCDWASFTPSDLPIDTHAQSKSNGGAK